jgi:putative YhdH/YhfP family quinone oxidoreductase
MTDTYRAWVVRETETGFSRQLETRSISELPDHPVLIKVAYSGLNYKDGLSASGHRGVTRTYPHVPGIDAVGVVVEDATGTMAPGQSVICTSYDLGMNTHGAFSEYIRVPVEWVVELPQGMTPMDAMTLGSAGYTAGLALWKMERNGQHPSMGPIAVTGASGGVGSLAVALLHHAGYRVIAGSGSPENADFLRQWGADEIRGREAFDDTSGKPLTRPEWAGAIDNVGGNTLATLLKSCGRNGNVASIGLVASSDLITTVFPFILNGVNLLGIDSAETPSAWRRTIWNLLATDWKLPPLEGLRTVVDLEDLNPWLDQILAGRTCGRVVVRVLPD